MSNGKDINERLEFQERIKIMPIEERTTETALMIYDLSHKFDGCVNIKGSKKAGAVSGGITATIISVVIAVIEYFRGR